MLGDKFKEEKDAVIDALNGMTVKKTLSDEELLAKMGASSTPDAVFLEAQSAAASPNEKAGINKIAPALLTAPGPGGLSAIADPQAFIQAMIDGIYQDEKKKKPIRLNHAQLMGVIDTFVRAIRIGHVLGDKFKEEKDAVIRAITGMRVDKKKKANRDNNPIVIVREGSGPFPHFDQQDGESCPWLAVGSALGEAISKARFWEVVLLRRADVNPDTKAPLATGPGRPPLNLAWIEDPLSHWREIVLWRAGVDPKTKQRASDNKTLRKEALDILLAEWDPQGRGAQGEAVMEYLRYDAEKSRAGPSPRKDPYQLQFRHAEAQSADEPLLTHALDAMDEHPVVVALAGETQMAVAPGEGDPMELDVAAATADDATRRISGHCVAIRNYFNEETGQSGARLIDSLKKDQPAIRFSDFIKERLQLPDSQTEIYLINPAMEDPLLHYAFIRMDRPRELLAAVNGLFGMACDPLAFGRAMLSLYAQKQNETLAQMEADQLDHIAAAVDITDLHRYLKAALGDTGAALANEPMQISPSSSLANIMDDAADGYDRNIYRDIAPNARHALLERQGFPDHWITVERPAPDVQWQVVNPGQEPPATLQELMDARGYRPQRFLVIELPPTLDRAQAADAIQQHNAQTGDKRLRRASSSPAGQPPAKQSKPDAPEGPQGIHPPSDSDYSDDGADSDVEMIEAPAAVMSVIPKREAINLALTEEQAQKLWGNGETPCAFSFFMTILSQWRKSGKRDQTDPDGKRDFEILMETASVLPQIGSAPTIVDSTWNIARYSMLFQGQLWNFYLALTHNPNEPIADIRPLDQDDVDSEELALIEDMCVKLSERPPPQILFHEDAAGQALAPKIATQMAFSGDMVISRDMLDITNPDVRPKDRLDYSPINDRLWPYRQPGTNGREVYHAHADPNDPTKVAKDLIIEPGGFPEEQKNDLYKQRAQALGKDVKDLTPAEKLACIRGLGSSLCKYLTKLKNGENPVEAYLELIENLKKSDLPDPNDHGVLDERGVKITTDTPPSIRTNDILAVFVHEVLITDEQRAAAQRLHKNCRRFWVSADVKMTKIEKEVGTGNVFPDKNGNVKVEMNTSSVPSMAVFFNTAITIAGGAKYNEKLNCDIFTPFIKTLRPSDGRSCTLPTPTIVGRHNLGKGNGWLYYGPDFLKEFNQKPPSLLLPQIPIKREAIEGGHNWETIKAAFPDTPVIREFSDWVKDNIEAEDLDPSIHVDAFTSWAKSFGITFNLKKQDYAVLTKLGRHLFSDDYQFDLSRPDGLVVKTLKDEERRQADKIWDVLLQNTLPRKINIQFMKDQLDAVCRTLMQTMNSQTPHTQLETQKRRWFKAADDSTLISEIERVRQEIKEGMKAQFEAIKSAHEQSIEYQKATPTNKERQKILLDCIRDVFTSGVSAETLTQIDKARRLQSDIKQVTFEIAHHTSLSQGGSAKNAAYDESLHRLFNKDASLSPDSVSRIYLQVGDDEKVSALAKSLENRAPKVSLTIVVKPGEALIVEEQHPPIDSNAKLYIVGRWEVAEGGCTLANLSSEAIVNMAQSFFKVAQDARKRLTGTQVLGYTKSTQSIDDATRDYATRVVSNESFPHNDLEYCIVTRDRKIPIGYAFAKATVSRSQGQQRPGVRQTVAPKGGRKR